MARRILITGGAGFIGSHLADELLAGGYAVRALDSLAPQVHGAGARRPAWLDPQVELQVGDVRDPGALRRALAGVDAVVHLAAAVGVGQSMYEVAHYTGVNAGGTAALLEALMAAPVERLVVASSMSIYGEGRYVDPAGRAVDDATRGRGQLEAGAWELVGPNEEPLRAVPTPEEKRPMLASVYALSKYDQERLCLMIGEAYGMPTVALRFFNVYGPRQALSNPYTGVLAIFGARLLNGRAPLVFEDGGQRRDFVHVADVARACRCALEADGVAGLTFNVGSGRAETVRGVAERMARALGRPDLVPHITGDYRVGDIRHCFADIRRAERLLGYAPRVPFERGVEDLVAWLRGQQAEDRVGVMRQELAARGLTVSGGGAQGGQP